MRCQALSVGVDVPVLHFSGTVHSVFQQACNLWLEPGMLLTLLPSQKGNVPHGIRLNTSHESTFADLAQVGQPVACRGGLLRIDGADFSVDLRNARLWQVDLRSIRIDLRRPVQAQAWVVAWSELRRSYHTSERTKHFGSLSPPQGQPIISVSSKNLSQQRVSTILSLLQATCYLQLEKARLSIRSLIGFGCGLTPSGDDFLVGYVTGLWITAGSDSPRTQFLYSLSVELHEAAHSTNTISCAYLEAAAKGHVSELIATLAQQLERPNDMRGVRTATQAALQVGHTSGRDGVLGMLLGCIAWQQFSHYHENVSDLLDISI